MGMGTPQVSSSAAAFWQQARGLPHMNTFNMNTNSQAAGHMAATNHMSAAAAHQYSSHHGQSPHDAKMAEKIVSELQVKISVQNYHIKGRVFL